MRHYLVLIIASTLLISLLAPVVQADNAFLHINISHEMSEGMVNKTNTANFRAKLDGPEWSGDYNIKWGVRKAGKRVDLLIKDHSTATAWYWGNSRYEWKLTISHPPSRTEVCTFRITFRTGISALWLFWIADENIKQTREGVGTYYDQKGIQRYRAECKIGFTGASYTKGRKGGKGGRWDLGAKATYYVNVRILDDTRVK